MPLIFLICYNSFVKYRTSSFFRQFSDTSRKPDQTWNPYYESQFHLTHGNGSGQCVKHYGEGHLTQFFQKIYPSKVSLLFAKVCVIWKQWDAEHLPGGAILAPKVRARSGVKLASTYIEVIPTVLSWSWMPNVKILTFFELGFLSWMFAEWFSRHCLSNFCFLVLKFLSDN